MFSFGFETEILRLQEMKFQKGKAEMIKYIRLYGLLNLRLVKDSIGNALFANVLFTAPDRFKFPNAGSTSNSNEKSCSINVTDVLNMDKVKIKLSGF